MRIEQLQSDAKRRSVHRGQVVHFSAATGPNLSGLSATVTAYSDTLLTVRYGLDGRMRTGSFGYGAFSDDFTDYSGPEFDQ
jgi:hypothetical protein